jgi:hypothetical protein
MSSMEPRGSSCALRMARKASSLPLSSSIARLQADRNPQLAALPTKLAFRSVLQASPSAKSNFLCVKRTKPFATPSTRFRSRQSRRHHRQVNRRCRHRLFEHYQGDHKPSGLLQHRRSGKTHCLRSVISHVASLSPASPDLMISAVH